MSHDDKTISDRTLTQGDGLILGFPTEDVTIAGKEDFHALRGYFMKVSSAQTLYYEYDQLSSFNSGDTVDFGYLGESSHENRSNNPGEDIFRIEDDDWHLLHFGYTPQTPALRVYHKISQSNQSNAGFNRRGSSTGPVPGDDRSFVTSKRSGSPADPSAITERASFRNDDDGELLEWGFEATDDISAAAAQLNFIGQGYKLLPVTDEQERERMMEIAQTGSSEGDYEVSLIQLGGLYDYRVGQLEPEAWDTVDEREGFTETLTFGTTNDQSRRFRA